MKRNSDTFTKDGSSILRWDESTKEKTISSLEIAEMMEKEHKNLLADIRGYVEELGELKIQPTSFMGAVILNTIGDVAYE